MAGYRPRVKLFDSDPVAPGGEAVPAPPLPAPFVSQPHMALDACADAATGVSVSVARVLSTAHADGVPPAGAALLVLLSIKLPRWLGSGSSVSGDGAVAFAPLASFIAPTTSKFELEWQCSRDVYSPYVMKTPHSLRVDVLPGPHIVDVKEFELVSLHVGYVNGGGWRIDRPSLVSSARARQPTLPSVSMCAIYAPHSACFAALLRLPLSRPA